MKLKFKIVNLLYEMSFVSEVCVGFLKCMDCNTLEAPAGLPDGSFSNQKVPIWVNFGWP
jgi:hypothetical protein